MQITKSSIDKHGAEILWAAVDVDPRADGDKTYLAELSLPNGSTLIASASFVSEVTHMEFFGVRKDEVIEEARSIFSTMVGSLADHLDITTNLYTPNGY